MSDTTTPVQTHGDGKRKRSRSKGQQIIEACYLIRQHADHVLEPEADGEPLRKDVDVASVAEIIRLADRLRELIRIPR